MVYLNISIDVEKDLHKDSYRNLMHLQRFLNIAKKYNLKPTFFVTGECIRDNMAFFKALIKKYEIASHSFNHIRLDDLSKKEKIEQIKKAFNDFKEKLKIKPKGFRAPQFSMLKQDLRLIEKTGFTYDSSFIPNNLLEIIFFPKFLKTSIRQIFAKNKPHKLATLWEFPASALIVPFSSFTLRLCPLFVLKIMFKLLSIKNKLIIFTAHSWDFMELKDSVIYSLCPLDKFIQKFKSLMEYLILQAEPISLGEYVTRLEK